MIREMTHDRDFWRSVIMLTIPIALQNLLSNSLAIIDNLMIGKLGDLAVGAVGISAQIAFLVNVSLFGLSAGGSVFGAQYWGKKDLDGIRRTYGLVTLCCSAVSILASILISLFPEFVLGLYTNSADIIRLGARYLRIAAFSYIGIAVNLCFCTILRSTEQVKLPVISNLISILVNVFLNGVLIFGLWGFPKMGIRGAAVATVIASFVNPLVILVVALRKNLILKCPWKKMFAFPKGFVRKYFSITLPVFFNEIMWSLGVAGTNMVYGRMGETNIAAMAIARTVENIAVAWIVGLGNASAVMVGKAIGAGKRDKAQVYANRFTVLTPFFCLIIAALILFLRTPIVSLFSLSPESARTAAWLLAIYGMEMPLRNIPYISIIGVFRPGGDTTRGVLYDLCFLWCLSLPLTVFLGLVWKAPFLLVYTVMLLSEDIPKAFLCIRFTLSGKWIHSVTEPEAVS